ncbi:hypothetical protein ACB092_04G060200 [Castanea dentata]
MKLLLGLGLILNQSPPLTGHSPFHSEMERIQIPRIFHLVLRTNFRPIRKLISAVIKVVIYNNRKLVGKEKKNQNYKRVIKKEIYNIHIITFLNHTLKFKQTIFGG